MAFNNYDEMFTNKLISLSLLVVDNNINHKLDYIASISINNNMYFHVYRRYNSPYNIVIEDKNKDIYLHEDTTIRNSLSKILCLPENEIRNMYTVSAFSYKHGGPVPSLSNELVDMRWTELQTHYQAASINISGILYVYVPIPHPVKQENIYNVSSNGLSNGSVNANDSNAANALLSIRIPTVYDPFELRECDGKNLSMKNSDVLLRKRKREEISTCYCTIDDDTDSEFNEENYTVLRSGTAIRKLNTDY